MGYDYRRNPEGRMRGFPQGTTDYNRPYGQGPKKGNGWDDPEKDYYIKHGIVFEDEAAGAIFNAVAIAASTQSAKQASKGEDGSLDFKGVQKVIRDTLFAVNHAQKKVKWINENVEARTQPSPTIQPKNIHEFGAQPIRGGIDDDVF